MSKRHIFFIAVALSASILTSCMSTSSQPQTDSHAVALYRAMVKANQRDQILARHKSCYWSSHPIKDEHGDLQTQAYGFKSLSIYMHQDYVYQELDFSGIKNKKNVFEAALYTPTDEYWCTRAADGTIKKMLTWFAMTDTEKKERLYKLEYFSAITDGEPFGEHIVSSQDNGDGTLTILTNAKIEIASDVNNPPEAWKNATVEYSYLLDAKTCELKKISVAICTKKEKISYIEETAIYDVEPPQGYATLNTFATKELLQPAAQPRTVTVIYNPGTTKEERFTKSADTSYGVSPVYRSGYKPFKEPEGTTPFTGGDGKSDVIIYALPATSK